MNTTNTFETLKYSTQENGDVHITITAGEFEGITFKYGRTWFPNPDEPVLSFEYDIISASKKYDKIQFEQFLGEILHILLRKAVDEQSVVYTGGTNPTLKELDDNTN